MTPEEREEYDMLSWRIVADLPVTSEECDRWSELRKKDEACRP